MTPEHPTKEGAVKPAPVITMWTSTDSEHLWKPAGLEWNHLTATRTQLKGDLSAWERLVKLLCDEADETGNEDCREMARWLDEDIDEYLKEHDQ